MVGYLNLTRVLAEILVVVMPVAHSTVRHNFESTAELFPAIRNCPAELGTNPQGAKAQPDGERTCTGPRTSVVKVSQLTCSSRQPLQSLDRPHSDSADLDIGSPAIPHLESRTCTPNLPRRSSRDLSDNTGPVSVFFNLATPLHIYLNTQSSTSDAAALVIDCLAESIGFSDAPDSGFKMPSTSVADLNSLLRSTSIVDDEELLKACNAKIKADKSDLKAQHFRVVALLKLDRFDDALRAIAEGGATLESACTLEKAYALYKTGQLDEANEALKAAGEDKRGFRHVRAQVAYRAEKYDQAKDCYESLLQAGETEENNDIGINLAAVAAQAEWTGTHLSGSAAKDQQYESFELCYNAACACIAKGAFRDAERLLRSASMLCDSSDELSEDEKQSEMRPIVAQQAYVYTMQGREKEALELWRKLGDIEYVPSPS